MTALRIGIDARLVAYRRGMGHCVHSLLHEFAQLPTEHRFVIYVDQDRAREAVPACDRFTVRQLKPRLYPLWEQWALPTRAARDRLDVLHSPANTAPVKLSRRIRLVMTIHDVMYLLPRVLVPLPRNWYQRLGRYYRRWIVPRAAQRADWIISDSQYSKSDTMNQIGLPQERMSVVHAAPSLNFRRLSAEEIAAKLPRMRELLDVDKPLIVHLGSSDPRKNTSRVIEAFAQLQRTSSPQQRLVIVGLNAAEQKGFAQQLAEQGVADKVSLLGFVAEEELVWLYNVARIVVYPSLYEGFGLPVVEAMACGAPVITSNVTSLPEVAGDGALLIDPLDITALARGMASASEDAAVRQSLIERGQAQVRRFSWHRAAQETLRIYEEVCQA